MPSELITLEGHIINSMSLSKTLDKIIELGGDFKLDEIELGKTNDDTSYTQIQVSAKDQDSLDSILAAIGKLGAVVKEKDEIHWKKAPKNGVFPDDFYSTTNLETQVWYHNKWIPVQNIEMDCGVIFDPVKLKAYCRPLFNIKKGDRVIVGHEGVRVIPLLSGSQHGEVFSFMNSSVSSEKPKHLLISEIAHNIKNARKQGKNIMFVGGPAVIHTGAGVYVSKLIEKGFIQVLLAGNGFATHDIESNLFGTSLGIHLDKGTPVHGGHRNHLRAINTIRQAGSIHKAVEKGILNGGIMYSCVKNNVPYVLTGSIRDDGPLPDVITDSMVGQDKIRHWSQKVDICLIVASTLHAIATGNCLPARVYTICVDINPAVVTKLSDRGSAQSIGMVTDSESFLRELVRALN